MAAWADGVTNSGDDLRDGWYPDQPRLSPDAVSNANFGHVLGLPPDDPRVRRLALRAYQEYGRYLVDLMRLPSLPADEIARFAG